MLKRKAVVLRAWLLCSGTGIDLDKYTVPVWLVWQARVKVQTWFDAVLVVIYGCGRQLLAVAASIGCFVCAAAICLWEWLVLSKEAWENCCHFMACALSMLSMGENNVACCRLGWETVSYG